MCEKDDSHITTMVCDEGRICIGPSNITEGISISKATQMYQKGTFCVKGSYNSKWQAIKT